MNTEILLSKQLTLGDMLRRNASTFPDNEALVYENRKYSYRHLNDRANRLANGLGSLGITKGDKIAVLSRNCPEMVETYFALHKLGAVVVPLNVRLAAREMLYQINNSDAKAIMYQGEFGAVIASMHPELASERVLSHYICNGQSDIPGCVGYEEIIQRGSVDEPIAMVEDHDPAFILYTAGTTGRPKGAVITHKNQLITSTNYALEVATPRPARGLLLYPLFHSGGVTVITWWFVLGATIVIENTATAEAILSRIESEKITITSLTPALWIRLSNHPGVEKFNLSSLCTAVTGSAPTSRETKKRIVEIFPNLSGMYECFGMTETCAGGVLGTPQDMLRKEKSLGKTMLFFEVHVFDDNDRVVPVGDVGEVVYRGPGVFQGYYKNPDATDEGFRSGWFHSGDLVYQDEDRYFYFSDRKKDMIKSGGENIYASEVEEVLYTHPKIMEAAVIGVPDPEWGHNVKAIVVLKPGHNLTEAEVIEYCKKNLASYKKPKSVEFISELPRSAQGKVLKYVLRDKYGKAQSKTG